MDYIQPQFVKFNSNVELPDNIKERYFIYIVIGLINRYGVPAIYVELDSYSKYVSLLTTLNSYETILSGTDDFVLNTDYYINEATYHMDDYNEYLPDGEDDDIWIEYGELDEYGNVIEEESKYESLNYLPSYCIKSGVNKIHFDILDNSSVLFTYYAKKNSYLTNTYSEDELNNFYSTFCSIILKYTTYSDTSDNTYQIYKQVLNYYTNYSSDDTLVGMNLILGSMYGTASTTSTSCGCSTSSSSSSDTVCAQNSVGYYKSAMELYLQQMLSSTDFYNNWFFVTNEESNTTIVNLELIGALEELFEEFIALGYDLSLSSSSSSSNCSCPTVSTDTSSCNLGYINNYVKVIGWVKTEEIEENTNKIKVYGTQFASILPYLQF